MAIAYEDGDHLVLFAARGEVAPLHAISKTSYWALTAFGVLCEEEVDQFPVTRWMFRRDMVPAVSRILAARERHIEVLDKDDCLERAGRMLQTPVDKLAATM